MKHDDIYQLICAKVGLIEDREYKRLYNSKDLYGEALGPLSVRNFKRFIAVLYYLIVEKQSQFDLIVGAGDSGIALTKVIEIFYQINDLKPPKMLNIPITRFNYGFTFYDNSVLIPEVKEELKPLKQLKQILFVDDEIANGTTLKASLEVLIKSVNKDKISNPLKVYLVAEDQDFKTDNFMQGVDIEMYPFAKEIKGLLTVIRYVTPWSIQLKIREHFNDDQIGSKSLINLLLDVQIKETELIEGIKIPKAKFTYRERDLLKREVPGFEKLQQEFRDQIEKWIKESISEYTKKDNHQQTNIQAIVNQINQLNKQKTLLIAIDGFGGSGKSTLAINIKKQFPNTDIVHLDDFYSHQLNRADRNRLINQVIKPLKNNQQTKYQRYDWSKKELAEWIEINPGGIVLIEGVSTLHDDFNDYYDFRIWLDFPQEEGFKRGLERDKKEYGVDTTNEWLNVWMPQEKKYFQTQKPIHKADFIVKAEE